jgi:hypothetical protein
MTQLVVERKSLLETIGVDAEFLNTLSLKGAVSVFGSDRDFDATRKLEFKERLWKQDEPGEAFGLLERQMAQGIKLR